MERAPAYPVWLGPGRGGGGRGQGWGRGQRSLSLQDKLAERKALLLQAVQR